MGASSHEEAVDNVPLVVFVVVLGEVEYVKHDATVQKRITTADRIADYRRYCEETGIEAQDLSEA